MGDYKFNTQGIEPASILCFTGDLVLDLPDAAYWLSGLTDVLRSADYTIAHLEVPHTDTQDVMEGDVPAPGAPPANLSDLKPAGIDCVSLAGNHIADCGAVGIADTLRGLRASGIDYTGAGENIAAARSPVLKRMGAATLGFLSYNCVGPVIAWATDSRAGCAYLPVETANGDPVAPPSDIVAVAPDARDILADDIANARSGGADLIVVALHKGKVHTPAYVDEYERELAHLAIDAGADIVIAHHAHITRGFEFYCGKPIFHGLGNGCVVTEALSPGQDNEARAAWVEKRKTLFGFEPDPAYTFAPFHPEAVNGMIGVAEVSATGALHVGFVPVFSEPPGKPTIATGKKRDSVIGYLAKLNERAGLSPVNFNDTGTTVWVSP